MEPADPFTIQGRPYIDQKGDFVVLASEHVINDAAATKEPEVEGATEKMVKIVAQDPKVSARTLRRVSGYGLERVKEMAAQGWTQNDGEWVEDDGEEQPAF